jgi:integrase
MLERQKEPPGKLAYLSPAQLAELIDAAKMDQSDHALPFVMIAGHTGMRHESVISLRAGDIDSTKRIIWVGKDKAGRREQPMPAMLAEYLRKFCDGMKANDLLFPSKRAESGRVYQINSIFARCVERAGLSREITPHSLRHTVATNAAHAGLDAATIQAIGGWKTRQMAERYTHAASMSDAMSRLENQLSSHRRITQKLHRRSRRVA